MSLPWVSRALFERSCHESDRLRLRVMELEEALRLATARAAVGDTHRIMLASAESRLTASEARYDALLVQYHALRVQGAVIPDPPRPPARPDPVTEAMITRSRGSSALRNHYLQYIAGQRAAGVGEDAIAGAILMGVEDMEGVPG